MSEIYHWFTTSGRPHNVRVDEGIFLSMQEGQIPSAQKGKLTEAKLLGVPEKQSFSITIPFCDQKPLVARGGLL